MVDSKKSGWKANVENGIIVAEGLVSTDPFDKVPKKVKRFDCS